MRDHQGRCEGAESVQWFLNGDWSKEEIDRIESYLKACMKPSDNYFWSIHKFSLGHFEGKRIYWSTPSAHGKDIERLIKNMEGQHE